MANSEVELVVDLDQVTGFLETVNRYIDNNPQTVDPVKTTSADLKNHPSLYLSCRARENGHCPYQTLRGAPSCHDCAHAEATLQKASELAGQFGFTPGQIRRYPSIGTLSLGLDRNVFRDNVRLHINGDDYGEFSASTDMYRRPAQSP
jgi:hypothetical protein